MKMFQKNICPFIGMGIENKNGKRKEEKEQTFQLFMNNFKYSQIIFLYLFLSLFIRILASQISFNS